MFGFSRRQRGTALALTVLGVILIPLGLLMSPGEGGARGSGGDLRPDPPRFQFVLERDGTVFGSFSEVSGLGSEHEVVEYREGGDDTGVVRKIPGQLKYPEITLKRGITSDLAVWEWRSQVENDFASARSQLTIRMLDPNGHERAVWHLENAWPSKVTGPMAKSDSNEIGVEEVTIVHEFLERAS